MSAWVNTPLELVRIVDLRPWFIAKALFSLTLAAFTAAVTGVGGGAGI